MNRADIKDALSPDNSWMEQRVDCPHAPLVIALVPLKCFQ